MINISFDQQALEAYGWGDQHQRKDQGWHYRVHQCLSHWPGAHCQQADGASGWQDRFE